MMWELRFDGPLDAWAVVPAPDEHERRRQWGVVVADMVREYWEADEDARFSDALDQVLEMLQRSRPEGTLADLVTWPTHSPLPVRVTFHVAADDGATEWESLGFEASPYLSSPFGEGIQYSRRIAPELTQGSASIDAAIIFDRGDAALVVRVHACPLDAYMMAAPAIAETIDSCVLTDSTGNAFATGKREHLLPADSDQWLEEGTGIGV
ncbi:hypothetical protein ACTU6V_03495 [Microbacterium sp. A204]|uniref:hypothetical protein n=1 Tax=unclassified Microbacterium TaxID=2609290 RepID=UPI003FD23557